MHDLFYILVTTIFGLFVLFLGWWLYRALTREPTWQELHDLDWNDDQLAVARDICRKVRARTHKKKATAHANAISVAAGT